METRLGEFPRRALQHLPPLISYICKFLNSSYYLYMNVSLCISQYFCPEGECQNCPWESRSKSVFQGLRIIDCLIPRVSLPPTTHHILGKIMIRAFRSHVKQVSLIADRQMMFFSGISHVFDPLNNWPSSKWVKWFIKHKYLFLFRKSDS